MREKQLDIWTVLKSWAEPHEAPVWGLVCITTNGYIKTNGEAVMGRGVAEQAKDRYPDLPKELGMKIRHFGNHVHFLKEIEDGLGLASFPVKHVWNEPATLDLIEQSAIELRDFVHENHIDLVYLPRPGCGNGQLEWEEVKPVIEPILSEDIYTVVHQ